jgi:catalase
MRVDGNGGSEPNYFPNSFDSVRPDAAYRGVPEEIEGGVADWFDRNGVGENDHYTQPGIFWRDVLSAEDKQHLVSNVLGAMSGISGPKRGDIINRQLCHFFRADIGLGMAIAQGLGLDMSELMGHMQRPGGAPGAPAGAAGDGTGHSGGAPAGVGAGPASAGMASGETRDWV